MSIKTPNVIFPGLVFIAILALVVFSGCGGSSDSSSSSSAGAEGGSTAAQQEEGGSGGEESGSGAQAEGGGESNEAGGSGGAGTQSVSGTEFTKEADQICAKAQKATNAQLGRYIGQNSEQAVEELVDDVIVPELEGEIQGIQALGASGAAGESSEALVTILEGLIDEAEADPKSFVLEGKPVIEATKEGKQLGFKSCGAV
jgi:hypothetical protein